MLANITVDKKAVRNKFFTYRIPKKLKPLPGSLVLVPFHGQRIVGVVNSIEKDETKRFKVKEIESIIYPQSLLDRDQIKLAHFIAKKYFAPLSSAIFAMLPHYLRKIKRVVIPAKATYNSVECYVAKAGIHGFRVKHGMTNQRYLLFDPQNKYTLKIYRKAIKSTLTRSQSVLFLTPDISLPIVKEIKKTSKHAIIYNKDQNSDKENFITWQKIKEGKKNLVIGSHMALFTPLNNLGLIIIHHENDHFYKNEQMPKYHLRDVAIELSRLKKASLILESKIPSLESCLQVLQRKIKLIPYKNFNTKLGLQHSANHIKIVDLKNERGLLSLLAIKTIEDNLKNKKRTLLFLNRKGFSRFLICQDCGYSKHLSPEESMLAVCPDCSGTNIKEHSFGTRRLEFEIKKMFPQAKILRLDKEINNNCHSHENGNLYNKIDSCLRHVTSCGIVRGLRRNDIHNYDIVIATSYIFKFDLNFDSIIVILAEIGLSLPDFRSEEELFSTLFRALSLGKDKIIQTFYPEHKVIRYLIEDNFANFAETELHQRKENSYPPFSILMRLTFEDKDGKKVNRAGKKLAKTLKELNQTFGSPNEILGPTKVFIQPRNLSRAGSRDKSKIEIILKGKNPYPLLSLVPENWKVDVDPIELLK